VPERQTFPPDDTQDTTDEPETPIEEPATDNTDNQDNNGTNDQGNNDSDTPTTQDNNDTTDNNGQNSTDDKTIEDILVENCQEESIDSYYSKDQLYQITDYASNPDDDIYNYWNVDQEELYLSLSDMDCYLGPSPELNLDQDIITELYDIVHGTKEKSELLNTLIIEYEKLIDLKNDPIYESKAYLPLSGQVIDTDLQLELDGDKNMSVYVLMSPTREDIDKVNEEKRLIEENNVQIGIDYLIIDDDIGMLDLIATVEDSYDYLNEE